MNKAALMILSIALTSLCTSAAAAKPRARDLGIPFDGVTGQFNAITDVTGVTVGYSTLIHGEGERAVRTGVTAVLPRGKAVLNRPVFAAKFSLNGTRDDVRIGSQKLALEGPIMIMNTHSVGTVRDAVYLSGVSNKANNDGSGHRVVVAGRRCDLARRS